MILLQIKSYSFFFGDGKSVASQVMQNLMIEQFLFNWIVQIHILIEKEMFLE